MVSISISFGFVEPHGGTTITIAAVFIFNLRYVILITTGNAVWLFLNLYDLLVLL